MNPSERIRAAAGDPNVVIGADGLLAEFNDAGILAPLDVLSAATVGRIRGEDDPQVLLAAALAVRGTRFGHVCIRLASQHEAVFVDGLEGVDTDTPAWPAPEAWKAAVARSPLVGDETADAPLVCVDDRLYLQRYHAYEDLVAGAISDRIDAEPETLEPSVSQLLDELLPAPDNTAGPTRQRSAAEIALSGRFAVIAGGPGTGKTHTIAAMLTALARSDRPFPLVALAAPTGKAAARLAEAITEAAAEIGGEAEERLLGVEGMTIHRLLGYHPARGRFLHDRDNRLPHDIVIIDEMSMVSLPLAARLLSAVRDAATVVLVGDPYQLESIEAGTVLADIVGPAGTEGDARGRPPIAGHVVVLDRVHRYEAGGEIAAFADAVRTGDADEAIRLLSAGSGELAWIQGDTGKDLDTLVERITEHRTNLVELARTPGGIAEALAALDGLAVLCAHHRGPQSVDEWRRRIETALDERFPGLRFGTEWYPGQPVMITANDYRLNLFNGDIGVTVETDDGPKVAFGRGGVRIFPRSHIGDHTTVHAMTIHKSQGSQFEEVVVALPAESSRLLTRELLYTAVTRASDRVTLIGEEPVIRHAIDRSVERASGLGVRLWRSGR